MIFVLFSTLAGVVGGFAAYAFGSVPGLRMPRLRWYLLGGGAFGLVGALLFTAVTS